eukprot:TRINITY_DN136022_c0_g1_i1.p1 TRINITY_DN136022_c0_g1~~TRINITY_DN136022_c0_g1_i1.p1  ORF type:complete len:554 (-),score=28.75 TRINITY_DN136022_c0_g1_i1:158-1819(-)
MHNSSGDFGEGDSINSFGDHRTYSEGAPSRYTAGNLTQHTTPAPEIHEENKDLNSSSDTANFFHNSQPDLDQHHNIDLSFDNDSVIGTTSANPIRLRPDPRDESGDQWDNAPGDESSYSGYTTSNHDDLTSQTRSTRTQDQALGIPRPTFSLNISNMLRRAENRNNSSSTLRMHPLPISRGEDHRSLDRPRPVFEEQIEEVLDEVVYLLGNERTNYKEMKITLSEQQKSFAEYYRTEHEKLMREKEIWALNLKRAKDLYSDEIFQINIGGTHKITASKKTLCKFPESMLGAMFSGRHKLRTHKGKVFIDRDGEAFCMMISYLRNCRIPAFVNRAQENLFYEELDYWQIPAKLGRSEQEELTEFDPTWCATTLRLENSNTLVRKHGMTFLFIDKIGPQHGVVFCKHPFDTTRTYVEFRVTMNIHVPGRSSLFIGMVDRSKYRPEQLISTFWKDSPSSYYWDVWNGKLIKVDENGVQVGVAVGYGCPCQDSNDETVIGLSYDYRNMTLRYYKNGADQGIAFHNVPKGLYPAIDLWFESGHVEIGRNGKVTGREYL